MKDILACLLAGSIASAAVVSFYFFDINPSSWGFEGRATAVMLSVVFSVFGLGAKRGLL